MSDFQEKTTTFIEVILETYIPPKQFLRPAATYILGEKSKLFLIS
jgi:hypothetical protein